MPGHGVAPDGGLPGESELVGAGDALELVDVLQQPDLGQRPAEVGLLDARRRRDPAGQPRHLAGEADAAAADALRDGGHELVHERQVEAEAGLAEAVDAVDPHQAPRRLDLVQRHDRRQPAVGRGHQHDRARPHALVAEHVRGEARSDEDRDLAPELLQPVA